MSTGRDSLKSNFKAGSLPTEDDFSHLIDSMLHMEDEGFSKSPEYGLKISSAPNQGALLTFFRKEEGDRPLWSLQHAKTGDRLNIHTWDGGEWKPPTVTLDRQNGFVGIGEPNPKCSLDVNGFVGSTGRIGTYPLATKPEKLQPDGEWHVIAKVANRSCVAFEVVACAQGGTDEVPHLSMVHAYAVNAGNPCLGGLWAWLDGFKWVDGWIDRTFNRKKHIRTTESRFGQRCDRIELSWRPETDEHGRPCYALAIRTRCYFGENAELAVRLTQLWPPSEPFEPTGVSVR